MGSINNFDGILTRSFGEGDVGLKISCRFNIVLDLSFHFDEMEYFLQV